MSIPKAGFGLLEVLLALGLFALLSLTLADVQMKGLTITKQAKQQTIAIYQLQRMAALLQRGAGDVAQWQAQNKKLLPNAESRVTQQGSSYQLILMWKSASQVWRCDGSVRPGYIPKAFQVATRRTRSRAAEWTVQSLSSEASAWVPRLRGGRRGLGMRYRASNPSRLKGEGYTCLSLNVKL